MPNKCIVNVTESNELWVYGKDLQRARYSNNLSRQTVCDTMNKPGFGYYPLKLLRYESKTRFLLPAHEVICLITALKAEYKII